MTPTHGSAARSIALRRPLASFATLALGSSWLVWIPALLAFPDARWPLFVGAFGPAVAGAVLVRLHGGTLRGWLRGIALVRVGARWYVFALAVPLFDPAAQAVLAWQSGVPLSLEGLAERLPLYLASFLVVVTVGGGQEELGWRGWLLPRLQRRTSPLLASLLVGVVHAAWHLPLFVFGALTYGDTLLGPYVAIVVAGSVVFTRLHHATRGSVLPAVVLHAQVNSASALVPAADLGEYGAAVSGTDLAVVLQVVLAVGWVGIAALLVARHGPQLGAAGASAPGHVPSAPRPSTSDA